MLKQVQHDEENINKAHLKFKWAFVYAIIFIRKSAYFFNSAAPALK